MLMTPSKYTLHVGNGPRKGYPWGQGRVSVSVRVTRGNRRSRRAGGMKPKSFIRKMPVVIKEQPPAVGKIEVLKSWYKLTMLFLLQAFSGVVSTNTSTWSAGTVSTLEHQSAQRRAGAAAFEQLWLHEMLENTTGCLWISREVLPGILPCFLSLDFHQTTRGHLSTSRNPLLK